MNDRSEWAAITQLPRKKGTVIKLLYSYGSGEYEEEGDKGWLIVIFDKI